ncbi:MAG TPA: UDP-glucose 4-epimerase GalE [Pseudomonadota bacterium]|nr:UDP-glucose 4-epimerase GalE [Pseudomonadota bacterium]
MRILVTGGVGFIGGHFVRAASEAGHRVVVLDDLSGGEPLPLPLGVTFVQGDIGDRVLLQMLCQHHHFEAVVHFAGKIQVGESVQRPELYYDVNLARSLVLLEELRKGGVRYFVFSSTAAVYGVPDEVPIPEEARKEPVNPYGATKHSFERALAAYGTAYDLRWAALRYFNAAGAHPDGTLRENHQPETHLIPLVLDAGLGLRPPLQVFGGDYPTRDGTCVRDYIHVCDLAAAHLAALTYLASGQPSLAANLGTGRGFTVREVLDAAAAVLGRPIPHTGCARRAGDPAELVAESQRARELLGFVPRRSELHTLIEDALRPRRERAR